MTITFQGHVAAMRAVPDGIELTIQTPMEPTAGAQFVVRVPAKDAQHWLPGRIVDFRLYALSPDLAPNAGVPQRVAGAQEGGNSDGNS